jgi:hypothetical protein
MKARVFKATVNNKDEWRVYFNMDLLATFDTEYGAQIYANYLNENY